VKSDLQPLKIHRRQNVKKRELKNLRDGMSPEDRIGAWLSAALEDPMVCDEMKQDIKDWFNQTHDRIVRATDFECPRCGHCCKTDLARVGEVGVWGEWVGLTDDEVAQAMYRADAIITGPMQFRFAKEIEAKLKEKNT
jgi:hypothetical protein